MIKFGTGGWRAVIADEFTKENIRLLMAGLCRLMEKEGLSGAEICVGYDRRFLSKESAHWAAEVLVGYGFHPFVINRSSPTPLMMFTVKKRQEPYGIAVPASHNPAIYNGIKVFTAGGRDADQTVTARIEAEIAKLTPNDVRSVDYDEALEKGFITEANPMNEYLDSILAAVDVDAIKKAALRIGFDPMYGVSWSSLSMLLTTCRCDLEVIHDRHDTLFGGKLPAPNVDTLKPLAALVLVCVSTLVQNLARWALGFLPKTEKWQQRRADWLEQLDVLGTESRLLLADKARCVQIFALQALKLFLLFCLPWLCIRFMQLSPLSFARVQLLTSLMLFVSNALPNVAGMGSIETAFLLLYSSFLPSGEVMSVLMLYRIASYYFVFAASAVGFFLAQRRLTRTPPKED